MLNQICSLTAPKTCGHFAIMASIASVTVATALFFSIDLGVLPTALIGGVGGGGCLVLAIMFYSCGCRGKRGGYILPEELIVEKSKGHSQQNRPGDSNIQRGLYRDAGTRTVASPLGYPDGSSDLTQTYTTRGARIRGYNRRWSDPREDSPTAYRDELRGDKRSRFDSNHRFDTEAVFSIDYAVSSDENRNSPDYKYQGRDRDSNSAVSKGRECSNF